MGLNTEQIQPQLIQFALGFDVSKATITFFDTHSGEICTLENSKVALKAILKPYAGRLDTLAICEATGGYEDNLLDVLEDLAIPAHRADAARVKAFIRACGANAKTDAIDARHIAEYGLSRAESLPRWRPSQPREAKIKLLVLRRTDLVSMRVQEENRLKAPRNKPIARDIAGHITEIKRRIEAIDKQIETIMSLDKRLKDRKAILQTVPGIGKVIAPVLLLSCQSSDTSIASRQQVWRDVRLMPATAALVKAVVLQRADGGSYDRYSSPRRWRQATAKAISLQHTSVCSQPGSQNSQLLAPSCDTSSSSQMRDSKNTT